ncbi:MAG: hypothetical protein Kilf2KO_40340 [Rhodospirillales bacterium]
MTQASPTQTSLRALTKADLPWLLALNDACVPAVNALDATAMEALLCEAVWTGAVEQAGLPLAVLIAFAPGACYRSTNYAWFDAQEESFAYIDRVMVAQEGRGQGLGRRLYEALAAWASEAGYPRLCCEVNEVPPNPQSIAFHESLGFKALVSRINPADGKQVRMFERRLG